MLTGFLKKIFGSRNERLLRQYRATVARINALEPAMEGLSDAQLTAKTAEFKERYAQGESLDDLLPEAFAVVREAGKRVLGMRHFDVQLVGGMVLHYGKIAEMRTGVFPLPPTLEGDRVGAMARRLRFGAGPAAWNVGSTRRGVASK